MMRPGCSQCRRANIECEGYRDTFSLRLRDQTSLAARKTHERAAKSRTTSPKTESETECDETVSIHASVARELPEAPETLALSYFMHIYAPSAAFEYLVEVSATYLTTQPLADALLAPSLLLFSQNLRLPSVQALAQSHYATALRSTNSALSCPDLAISDSTLLAVLLLSLFEALVFQGRKIPVNWNAHTRGASELLRLRGEAQFDNSLGRHLFRHASLNIRTHCAQLGVRTPSVLCILESTQLERIYTTGRPRQFGRVVDGIANVRANINNLTPMEHFSKLLELNNDLENILDGLRREVPFEVIDATAIQGSIRTYKNKVYRYVSQRIARTWNMVRITRLFVAQMLNYALLSPRALDFPDETRARVQELITVTGTEMISDILHSVPYSLELSVNPVVSARALIYPLSGIAVFEFATPDAAEYALGRLEFIGRQYGFPQAIDSATMIAQTNDLEDW